MEKEDELIKELADQQKYVLELESTITAMRRQIKRGTEISMGVERRLVAAQEEIEELKDLISSAAPVTWAQAQWLDDVVAWEQKAAALLKKGDVK